MSGELHVDVTDVADACTIDVPDDNLPVAKVGRIADASGPVCGELVRRRGTTFTCTFKIFIAGA